MSARRDALRKRQSTTLSTLLACMVVSSVTTLVGAPFMPYPGQALAWISGFAAIEVVALLLSVRGHHTLAAWFITGMLSVGSGVVIHQYGGFTGSMPTVLFAWLVVAAAALPTRHSILLAIGILLECGVLIGLDALRGRPFDASAIMVYASTLPIVAIMVIMTVATQDRALARVIDQDARRAAEQEALATEQRRALQLAQEASDQKSRFLANMSHELRTPLNAILGYTEMVMEDVDAEGRESLGHVRAAGHQLLALIDDVLDLSRVEAGKLVLHPEEVDLDALVQRACATARPMVERNRNRLALTAPLPLGVQWVDGVRVGQILNNLLSNAAKFTNDGDITLAARLAEQGGVRLLVLRVTDTGIGISREQQARLFQPFGQADDATSRRFGGTGLGLVLCRHFAQLMGGTLTLTSEVGSGTTVEAVLPLPT